MEIYVTESSKKKELPSKTPGAAPAIIWTVKLSDGRTGEWIGPQIPNGTIETDLKIEDNQYGTKITWLKAPQKSFGGGKKWTPDPYKDAMIIAQSSLGKAVDLCCAGRIELKDLSSYGQKFFEQVYKMSEPFKPKA